MNDLSLFRFFVQLFNEYLISNYKLTSLKPNKKSNDILIVDDFNFVNNKKEKEQNEKVQFRKER